ncbi:MAG: OmpH family outer membrane protein [Bacteroidetes bacterium]|nr:OmpH family outer membrane protein [Bacteroidota bacterium]MBS1539850.1 OmpH family outer membrane protein [Bacteroidota bacterium]
MKNLSLILNGVLLVAVAVLFYFHFSAKNHGGSESSVTAPSDLKFAYIKSDSVLKHYDYFKDQKTILEAKGKKLEQDLQTRGQSLQNEISAYQKNIGNLTIGQAKALEEDLGKKQQNFRLYQQTLEQEVSNDQAKLTESLYTRITSFLKKYAEGSGLQVVLKFDQTSDVLFGVPGIDISQDVVKGLNDEYKIEKQNPVKSDSTKTKKK